MTKNKKRLLISFAALAGITIFALGSMEYTSRSEFCNNCHYMETFYEAWQHSSHSNVPCIQCHYPPGILSTFEGKVKGLEQLFKYVTQSYRRSKPWAEIPDESCLRSGCHETRLLEGKVEFKEGIIFDHTPHLSELRRGKKLRCTSCHSQIVQGEHISVTQSTCFLCHFKGVEQEASGNCTSCHAAPIASEGRQVSYDHTMIVERSIPCWKCHGEMVVGDGAVPLENCQNCHFEQEFLAQYADTTKMHDVHITQNKIECQQCHLQIQHKNISRTADIKPDCNTCHPEYHQAQLDLFRGTGGQGLDPYPSPMYEGGLNCQACHIFHQNLNDFQPAGETYTAGRKSCEPCHGTGYGDLVEQWSRETDQRLVVMLRLIEGVEKALGRVDTTTGNGRIASEALHKARYNYHLVQYGKSVHNITYADRLLKASHDFLGQAVEVLGNRYKLPPYPWTGEVVLPECASCHSGIENQKVQVFDLTFDHGRHLGEGGVKDCRTCHSNMRRHGEMVLAKEECLACHHSEEKREAGENCAPCHETQRGMYAGSLYPDAEPDMMNLAEVACRDCHVVPDSGVVRPTAQACIACHDQSYGEILTQWRNDTAESMDRVEELLSRFKGMRLSREQESIVSEAGRVLNDFKRDGSLGVHNSVLAADKLAGIIKDLEAVLPRS